MAITDIHLARAVQADRERLLASQLSLHQPPRRVPPGSRRPRRDERLRVRWSWRLPRPDFPVGYGR